MYSSVSEISEKFNISKRRVQTLCEQGRLSGAKRISGVWLIPSDVKKPKDKRYSKNKFVQLTLFDNEFKKNYTLNDICKFDFLMKASFATLTFMYSIFGLSVTFPAKYSLFRQYSASFCESKPYLPCSQSPVSV